MRRTGSHSDLGGSGGGGGGGRGCHVILCLVDGVGGDEAEEAASGGSGDHRRRRTNRRDLTEGDSSSSEAFEICERLPLRRERARLQILCTATASRKLGGREGCCSGHPYVTPARFEDFLSRPSLLSSFGTKEDSGILYESQNQSFIQTEQPPDGSISVITAGVAESIKITK